MGTDYRQQLLSRFNEGTAIVGIVGLGYVGLPLAVAFAEAGFRVIGIDLSEWKVNKLNSGESYIPDIPTSQLAPLVRNGKLQAFTDYRALETADAVSICVPTPLRKTKDPDMSFVLDATTNVAQICHAGMLIVLESTTYPGTTEEIVAPEIERRGFTVGQDVFVSFSPERIDPGNEKYTVYNTPKVVGGITPACTEIVTAYYQTIVEKVVKVSSPTAAEMVKLLENTFRAVNIGLVNEMALMCDKLNLDVWEIIEAAKSKPFGFMPFYPGPGLGGHCIPVDPHYLSWKLKALNYNARFIELASEINTYMPFYVVNKVAEALNNVVKPIRSSRIGVLGVAYKRDIDDVRESPALDIIHLLTEKGAEVEWNDPHVPSIRLENNEVSQSTPFSAEWLKSLDCLVIVTDHTAYDWETIVKHSPLIVDTRNATRRFPQYSHIVSL
ncbi:MAG: nucleotide sugar dehydrogenase [Chloroflexi bacterium]|nr:nucleotide sugar dehydrogenase [Chloroflexota bacterium]